MRLGVRRGGRGREVCSRAEATSDHAADDKVLLPVEVPLDVEMLDVDDDRTSVRTRERIRGLQQLRDQARHLFAAERAMHFDGGLTGERCAHLFAHCDEMRSALVE